MKHEATLRALITGDTGRMRLLGLVRSLALPDCWIGAGFVRDAAWDALHGRPPARPSGDVDVIWYDPDSPASIKDRSLEARLHALDGSVRWSVKNQARMHRGNNDPPYGSSIDAIRSLAGETATAVAVRRTGTDTCEIAAPFGLGELFDLVIRLAPRFAGAKRAIVLERVRAKAWLERWPNARLEL